MCLNTFSLASYRIRDDVCLDSIFRRELSKLREELQNETRKMVHDEIEEFKSEIRKIVQQVTDEKVSEMKEDLSNFSGDEFENFRENFEKELQNKLDVSEDKIRESVNQYLVECSVALVHPSTIISVVQDGKDLPSQPIRTSFEDLNDPKEIDESSPSTFKIKVDPYTSTPNTIKRKIPRFNWSNCKQGNDLIVQACKDNDYRRTISIKESIFEQGLKEGVWADTKLWYSRVLTRIDNVCRNQ